MKTIEIKKFYVSTFTNGGIGVYTAALTLKTPMKLSSKSEKARQQLLKKIPSFKLKATEYPKFTITYLSPDGGGEYQFLFENKVKRVK